MSAIPKVIPFAVPAQVSPADRITQAEIVSLLELRAQINRLSERAEAASSSIKTRLESGAAIEEGAHVARIVERFRANVPWKEKAIDLAGRLGLNGAAWAENVLKHTAKSRSVSLQVE